MSGSGPTMFGVFLQEESARDAAAALTAEHPEWKLFVAEPFDHADSGRSGVL